MGIPVTAEIATYKYYEVLLKHNTSKLKDHLTQLFFADDKANRVVQHIFNN